MDKELLLQYVYPGHYMANALRQLITFRYSEKDS